MFLPGNDRPAGGCAERSVHRHCGHIPIIGGQQAQVILQRPHRGAGAALPQGCHKLAGLNVLPHQVVGHGKADLVQFGPGSGPHHAVCRQAEQPLERPHCTGGATAKAAVHRHVGKAGIIFCSQSKPELHQPHRVSAAAGAQSGARVSGAAGIALGVHPLGVQFLPGRLAHHAVLCQTLRFLECLDRAFRGRAKAAIHTDGRQIGIKLRQAGQPELHLLHASPGTAAAQHGSRPRPGALGTGKGFTLAGQLGKVLDADIDIADLIPGRLAHHAVHSQGKLLLELFHAVLGGFIKRSGNGRFAEGRVVLGNAGELFLQHVDRGAGAAAAQGAAGVALRNGRNVVGGDQLHPAAIVIPQNFQGAFALLGAVHSAPLLHAGAGHAFAIAILGIIGFGVPRAAHIGVEQLGSQALHHGKHRAPPHIRLVHPRRVGNVKAVAPAGVPFGPDAVQRQADLRQNVGPQRLLRPPGILKTHFEK